MKERKKEMIRGLLKTNKGDVWREKMKQRFLRERERGVGGFCDENGFQVR